MNFDNPLDVTWRRFPMDVTSSMPIQYRGSTQDQERQKPPAPVKAPAPDEQKRENQKPTPGG